MTFKSHSSYGGRIVKHCTHNCRLGCNGIVFVPRYIAARIHFLGFIVSGISDRIIRIAVGKLLLGVDRTKLAVFEVGAGQCVAIEKLRTQHVSKQIQSECGGVN